VFPRSKRAAASECSGRSSTGLFGGNTFSRTATERAAYLSPSESRPPSPDGRVLLYSQNDGQKSDLMLIEHFR
jgi:hypothetical protein